MVSISDLTSGFTDRIREGGWLSKILLPLTAVIVIGAVLYYPIGMALVHSIDDDTAFQAETPEGGSRAVGIAAALIDREVNQHRWTANYPFFMPGAALDNMPNFQQGVISSLSRFAIEMSDQIGRTRGSSQVDVDLDKAAGLLKYSGTVWVFDFSTSLAPTATSEAQYRAAQKALASYNQRLSNGEAVFERRADNLQATLERIAADLGSSSAVIERHVADHAGGFIDLTADDIFYRTKGRIYGYYLLLRELGFDYANVLQEKALESAWSQLMYSLQAGADLQPFVVANGGIEGQIVPNHLLNQGFYLLRARTQLKEVSNILLK